VTEHGPDRQPKTAWQMLKGDFGWLNHLVSWKAIIAAFILVGIFGALFVVSGGIDISADKPDGWAAQHFLHFVFKRSVGSRARNVVAPSDLADPARVRLGAQHFDMVCANCHGRPGFGQSVVALSMSPRPQDLAKVLNQFSDEELYLIVEHGVKYSAMPSWPTDQRADEVWSMVAFLRQFPKLDAKAYREMTALSEKGPIATNAGNSDDNIVLRPANVDRNSPPTDEFLYTAPASGFSDQAFHLNPTATCARCHGADGTGAVTGGEAPDLTIQDSAYLKLALEAYTRGDRKSGFMQNIAAQLSGTQIATLSDYYAGLPVQTVSSPPSDAALVKRGETIATQGIREHAIPACSYCHESNGSKLTGAPHIAGQSAAFLRRQLEALRRGGRGSTMKWNPMPAEAHEVSDYDIAALAAYYSGAKPAKAAGGQQVSAPVSPIPADVAGGPAAAKQIFESRCTKCHANSGRGDKDGSFPDLTLQSAPYVAQTLYSFRTRARPNDKMQEIVDSLSFDDLTNLANYVGSLPAQPAVAKPDTDVTSRGAAIAMHGVPDRGVPACLSCHDTGNISNLPLIPRLQGQSLFYLRSRLDGFAAPHEAKVYGVDVGALNPMPGIAVKLSDQERADLAAYFAAASPLDKTAVHP
jgi:cytochrome c553